MTTLCSGPLCQERGSCECKTYSLEPSGPLLQRVEEMREGNRLRGNMFTNWIDPEKAQLLDALTSVLTMAEKTIRDDEPNRSFEKAIDGGHLDDAFNDGLELGEDFGHNQALSKMRERIEKALGVEG